LLSIWLLLILMLMTFCVIPVTFHRTCINPLLYFSYVLQVVGGTFWKTLCIFILCITSYPWCIPGFVWCLEYQYACVQAAPSHRPFLLNSGTTTHISTKQADFLDLHPIAPRCIWGLGSSTVHAISIGQVKLSLGNKQHISLKDVLFVPNTSVHWYLSVLFAPVIPSLVVWYKCHYVCWGFLAVYGQDYTKTTSPTMCMESLQILLLLTAGTHTNLMSRLFSFERGRDLLHGTTNRVWGNRERRLGLGTTQRTIWDETEQQGMEQDFTFDNADLRF
jgi:hypothetical protein